MPNWIILPALTPYEQAVSLMEQRVTDLINGKCEETIFLLEHPEIYTAGTNYNKDELLGTNNIPVIYTGRGGKFTYHGPGQRIIYPILKLNSGHRKADLKLYIRNLESWIINSLKQISIKSYRLDNMVGIWTKHNNQHAKIAAIGVRVKKWITYHGIAVNINPNLDHYNGIIPCGISNFPVTSISKLGKNISIQEFDAILKSEFKKIFG